MSIAQRVRFGEDGIIPVAVTDADTGRLLVLCYQNQQALEKTLSEGQVYVYSRSRDKVALKGATSGHTQRVRDIRVNCDENSLEIRVDQDTAACHAGYYSCFYRTWDETAGEWKIDEELVFDPKQVYG